MRKETLFVIFSLVALAGLLLLGAFASTAGAQTPQNEYSNGDWDASINDPLDDTWLLQSGAAENPLTRNTRTFTPLYDYFPDSVDFNVGISSGATFDGMQVTARIFHGETGDTSNPVSNAVQGPTIGPIGQNTWSVLRFTLTGQETLLVGQHYWIQWVYDGSGLPNSSWLRKIYDTTDSGINIQFRVNGDSGETIEITQPAYGYSAIDTEIPFTFEITLLRGGSYSTLLFYEKEGFYNAYTAGGGQSYAAAGTYEKSFTLTGLDMGTYKNFRAQLINSAGIIVADATSSVEIMLTGVIGGFGEGTYYTSSSTAWYEANIPAFITNYVSSTPSAFFTSVAGFVDSLLNSIYGLIGGFSNLFSTQSAIENGNNVRAAITSVIGFVNDFEGMFGGYPYAITTISYIIFLLTLFVISGIRKILLR